MLSLMSGTQARTHDQLSTPRVTDHAQCIVQCTNPLAASTTETYTPILSSLPGVSLPT